MILTISLAKHQYARGVYYTAEQGCSQILYHGRATFCSAVRCVAERDASRAIWATLGREATCVVLQWCSGRAGLPWALARSGTPLVPRVSA